MQTLVEPKAVVDQTLIQPFVDSVVHVMQTMCGFTPITSAPCQKAPSRFSVCGIIAFSGGLTGSISVSLTRIAAEKVVDRLTGTLVDANSAEFADAIGEIANMVAGFAKAQIGADAGITVPTVIISDRGCQFRPLTGVPCVVIPCSGEVGEFAVEVCIKRVAVL